MARKLKHQIKGKQFMDKIDLSKIAIKNLLEFPEFTNEVSYWIWSEWHKKEGTSLDDIKFRTEHSQGRVDIPQTFIALYNNELIGTVSLWNNERAFTQNLRPWLACLFVKNQFRKQGVGKVLQSFAIQKAKAMGYNKLYLMTEHTGYYEKLGWKFLENAPLGRNESNRIYEIILK